MSRVTEEPVPKSSNLGPRPSLLLKEHACPRLYEEDLIPFQLLVVVVSKNACQQVQKQNLNEYASAEEQTLQVDVGLYVKFCRLRIDRLPHGRILSKDGVLALILKEVEISEHGKANGVRECGVDRIGVATSGAQDYVGMRGCRDA